MNLFRFAKKPATQPETKKIFGGIIQMPDAYRESYSSGLTPEKLREYLEQANQGDPLAQYQLFDEMEEKDPHLFSELQKRKLALTRWDWQILPQEEDDPRSVEIAEYCETVIERISDFHDDLNDVMDALGKGVSFVELIWQVSEGQAWISDLEYIPQWHFLPTSPQLNWGVQTVWRMRTKENVYPGEELPAHKFIVHRMRAKSGSPVRGGLTRVCSWLYLFKNYSIKDWMVFLDLYGIPLRIGKYGQGAGEDEKSVLKSAVVGLGADGAGIISKETEIEIINAANSASANPHQVMASYCNRETSKAILGTVSSGDRGTGTYAEESALIEVREDLFLSDKRSIEATLRRDLLKPLVLFNFGPDAVDKYLPYFDFQVEHPVDLKAEAEVDRIIISELGLPASKSWLREKYGIPEPENEEDSHSVEKAPSMPFGMSRVVDLKKNFQPGSAGTRTLKMRPGFGRKSRIR